MPAYQGWIASAELASASSFASGTAGNFAMAVIAGLATRLGNNVLFNFIDPLKKYAHFVPSSAFLTVAAVPSLYIRHAYRLHGLILGILCDQDHRFT